MKAEVRKIEMSVRKMKISLEGHTSIVITQDWISMLEYARIAADNNKNRKRILK